MHGQIGTDWLFIDAMLSRRVRLNATLTVGSTAPVIQDAEDIVRRYSTTSNGNVTDGRRTYRGACKATRTGNGFHSTCHSDSYPLREPPYL
jgi:hypothetical protein